MAITDPSLAPIFQPDPQGPVHALVVAGACGNVGLGKLGQFARLLVPHGIPVIALDPSPAVESIGDKLRAGYGDRFEPAKVDAVLAGVRAVKGGVDDLPADLEVGFVFEAIPERLDLKHAFYAAVRRRDPQAYIFSATSGLTTQMLFADLPGWERCGVMHPFFPHLTNKLWEVARADAVTGAAEMRVVERFLGGQGMNVIGVRDVPAFAADRIFCGMMLEAVRVSVDLELSPAQVDDVCKKTFGTSPFFVHNLIPGANYLSAHCMELLAGEVDSTLYAIPEAWRPYVADPHKKWPYERGQTCPPEKFAAASDRLTGMMLALLANMIRRDVARLDAINFLCEHALAFRVGVPALAIGMGLPAARQKLHAFIEAQGITHAEQAAPVDALSEGAAPWSEIYVGTAVHDGVGLLSLKRTTLSHTFVAQLDAALERLQGDAAVRAIVIAPDGTYAREFGHGADLQDFVPVLGKAEAARGLIARWKKTLNKLRAGKPTVAALVGRVLGGSLEFATQCHARIAAHGAQLRFPETTVGVIPGLGGCHLVHRQTDAAGWPTIDRALLTGEALPLADLQTWGFVQDVVPVKDLPRASMKLASDLAAGLQPMPAFRTGPAKVTVDRGAPITNDAGVVLDADLREVIVGAIEQANATGVSEGSAIEETAATQSLTMSSSKIGVQAILRGKPPVFERPLG
jgi:enoyl-CoA hydratase / 3-hydroxyacyl-CoA dehydrogenase